VHALLPHVIVQVLASRQSMPLVQPDAGHVMAQGMPSGHLIPPVHGLHALPHVNVQVPFTHAPPASRQSAHAIAGLLPLVHAVPGPAAAPPAPPPPRPPTTITPPSPPPPRPAPPPLPPALPVTPPTPVVPAPPVSPAAPVVPASPAVSPPLPAGDSPPAPLDAPPTPVVPAVPTPPAAGGTPVSPSCDDSPAVSTLQPFPHTEAPSAMPTTIAARTPPAS
jgi:hypothetical protein